MKAFIWASKLQPQVNFNQTITLLIVQIIVQCYKPFNLILRIEFQYYLLLITLMKSEAKRSCHRFNNNQKNKKKDSKNKSSASPTLASSYSQKSLWARSYKNQPAPQQLRRKLWGKRFNFDVYSDDEQQQILAVMEEQQNQGNQKKRKILPHFKLISDQGQFVSKRNRIKSQFGFRHRQKCKSVQSLKLLPKVDQQKREQDDLKKLQRSKLSYFKDKNQFNQRKRKSSDSHTQIASKVQSLEIAYYPQTNAHLPQQIQENQAQQTKSDKLPTERSIITSEIQKLIVDQLDSRKRKEELKPKEIQEIIQQEKLQEQIDNRKIAKLRQSIQRFESQTQYLKYHRDEEYTKRSGQQTQQNKGLNLDQKQVDLDQNQETQDMKERCALIEECSSSGNQQDQKFLQDYQDRSQNLQEQDQQRFGQEENLNYFTNEHSSEIKEADKSIPYKVETVPQQF